MAKRFTDTEKWKDEWFTDLSNDNKVIWQYLLDTCDNAGIFKKNIKILNIMCNTNVSAEDILNTFKNRISVLSDDKWFINKFCVFQYGSEFLNSKNKAVTSAIQKLIENNIIDKTTNTLSIVYPYSIDSPSIPYQYPIDSPKEQEKDKDKVLDKDILKDKEEVLEEVIVLEANEAYTTSTERRILEKHLDNLIQYDDSKNYKISRETIDEYGGLEKVYAVLGFDSSQISNWNRKVSEVSHFHSFD